REAVPGTDASMWNLKPKGGASAQPASGAPPSAPAAPSGRIKALDYLYPSGASSATPAAAPTPTPAAGAPGTLPTGTIDVSRIGNNASRSPREQQLQRAAREKLTGELGREPNELEMQQETARLRAGEKSLETEVNKTTQKAVEMRNALADGKARLVDMKEAVHKLQSKAKGAPERLWDNIKRYGAAYWKGDPDYAVIQGFPAMFANLARSLSGEKGVLTDRDVERVVAAFGAGWMDNQEMYDKRVDFVVKTMERATEAVERAAREGRPPAKVNIDDLYKTSGMPQ
ncbi:MAG TPA: hypothetical protein VFQ55_00105, partial [Casimicrobiaceae bacterium]|nr:hypothetical protein [Casimicrobiaceae bacterium]